MPPDMRLRSDWEETSLSAPGDRGSIERLVARPPASRATEPIPLQMFLRYADWFRETFVPEADPSDVAHVERADGRFRDHDRQRATRRTRATSWSSQSA